MMPMVVVAGASGFIGAAVCTLLATRNIPVMHYRRNQTQTFPHGSVCIHVAGVSNLSIVEQQPSRCIAEAVDFAHTLLQRHHFSKIIFASSGVVYGDTSEEKRTEEDPVASTHPYARMKIAVEQLLSDAGHVIVRLANVFGAGMPSTSVLSHILNQLPVDDPLEIQNGTPIRDFVHVDDAARAFVDLALSPLTGIYNVGTGQGTSIAALARYVLDLAGQSQRPINASTKSSKRSSLILESSKIQHDMGWCPRVALRTGLTKLIASSQRSMTL